MERRLSLRRHAAPAKSARPASAKRQAADRNLAKRDGAELSAQTRLDDTNQRPHCRTRRNPTPASPLSSSKGIVSEPKGLQSVKQTVSGYGIVAHYRTGWNRSNVTAGTGLEGCGLCRIRRSDCGGAGGYRIARRILRSGRARHGPHQPEHRLVEPGRSCRPTIAHACRITVGSRPSSSYCHSAARPTRRRAPGRATTRNFLAPVHAHIVVHPTGRHHLRWAAFHSRRQSRRAPIAEACSDADADRPRARSASSGHGAAHSSCRSWVLENEEHASSRQRSAHPDIFRRRWPARYLVLQPLDARAIVSGRCCRSAARGSDWCRSLQDGCASPRNPSVPVDELLQAA